MLSLTRLTIRRVREECLPQVAGSLAFTTVLSVVPLLAVSFALFGRFALFQRFEAALEQHLLNSLLPRDIGRTVLQHLGRFAANAGELTWVGTVFILVAAVAMLLTVENALNRIWKVKKGRPLLKRVGLYLVVLALGPPAVGASLWATSYLFGVSLGWMGPVPPWAKVALDLSPALLGTLAFATLFYCVPNTRVQRRHAAIGGLIAGTAIELGKRGFAAYLLKMPTYETVYGAFATLPVFLLWVYFSWLAMLASALVTANLGLLQRRAGPTSTNRVRAPSARAPAGR